MGKCLEKATVITVRNDDTGEIEHIAISDFFDLV